MRRGPLISGESACGDRIAMDAIESLDHIKSGRFRAQLIRRRHVFYLKFEEKMLFSPKTGLQHKIGMYGFSQLSASFSFALV